MNPVEPRFTDKERKHLMRAIANADHAIAREVPVRRSILLEDPLVYAERGRSRLAELDRLIREQDERFPHRYAGPGIHEDERLRILSCDQKNARVEFEGGRRATIPVGKIRSVAH